MSNAIDAYAPLCEALLGRKSKSFRLAARLLPRPVRHATAILYAWCRRCDDALDERPLNSIEPPAEVVARLQRELDDVYRGAPQQDPILAAFQQVVMAYHIPRLYPEELILGMGMDARGVRYETLSDLLLYCYRVAGTVGLMMCHVMGVADTRALRNAAHLGVAMQLTNICRDVADDFALGRLYLPTTMLAAEGSPRLDPARSSLLELAAPHQRESIAQVVRALLAEAQRYYRSGDLGLSWLSWRAALAVRTARLLYAAIGTRLAAQGFDPLRGRASTPAGWKLAITLRALWCTLGEAPRRALHRFRPARVARVVRPHDVVPL